MSIRAAKLAGRPARIVLSREGAYRIVGGRTATEQRVAIGARADGRFEALIHTGTAAMTRHDFIFTTETGKPIRRTAFSAR